MIKVYTMPNCGPCVAIKHAMKSRGIEFEAIDMSVNPEAQAHVASLGYRQAPVVEVSPDNHWSGFRLDLIVDIQSTLAA